MWSFIANYWLGLLAIVDLIMGVSVTVHAVLWKRDSRAVIAWVGLAWFAPILGAFTYFCFGVNRIQRNAVSLRFREAWRDKRRLQLTQEELDRRDEFVSEHTNLVGLANLGRTLTGRAVLPGNKVEPLVNGDEAYPSMIAPSERSRFSVTSSTAIAPVTLS